MPSTRSVETCSPALPGGRLAAPFAAAAWRATRDSNGSRRAIFVGSVPSFGFLSLAVRVGAAGFLAGFVAAVLGAGFCADEAPGFPAVGAGGFWAPAAAGLAVCVAGFCGAGAAGFVCADNPGAIAARRNPTMMVIAGRIIRSFPLRVYQPVSSPPEASNPQAW